jgi:hypothetical protein
MATYDPPTETLPIFDPNVFTRSDTGLTTTAGDLRYLRFPYAQGSENLQQIDVYGVATFNTTLNTDDNIVMTGTPLTNYIEFPDTSKQYTAFTGTFPPLVPSPAGTYTTPSSVIVNSAGQITSATSGTTYTLPSPAPTAGNYTNANISVNSAGQITSASNGTGGTSSVYTQTFTGNSGTQIPSVPSNCYKCDICVISSGGYAGSNSALGSGTITYGGAGAGGNMAIGAGIPISTYNGVSTNPITITFSSTSTQVYIPIFNATGSTLSYQNQFIVCLNGGNGSPATTSGGGVGGIGNATANENMTKLGTFTNFYGNNGSVGGVGSSLTQYAGGIKNTNVWTAGLIGVGQKTNTDTFTGSGKVVITWYLRDV